MSRAHRALLALLLASAVPASPVEAQGEAVVSWERLPTFGDDDTTPPRYDYLAFLPTEDGSGPVAGHDMYVVSSFWGRFLFDPDADDERWGAWRLLRRGGPDTGFVSAEGTLFAASPGGATDVDRSADRGLTWEREVHDGATVLYQSRLPAFRGPSGHGAVVAVQSRLCRSLDDGRAGTWDCGPYSGRTFGAGEVPPSAALPEGRTLFGIANGVVYSDDLGQTWTPAPGAYLAGGLRGYSFAWMPEPGHPYGGYVLAGIQDQTEPDRDRQAVVVRSDDGGGTWGLVWRYDPDVWGVGTGRRPSLYAGPDGAVWVSVYGGTGSAPWPGRLLRSTDGGRTWEAADTNLDRYRYSDHTPGHGVKVNAWAAGPDGRLYIATESGVWRTTEAVYEPHPVATGEAPVPAPLAVRVWPNPTGGAATVEVSGPAERVRVAVFDVRGREVAVLHDGPATAGQRWAVETAGLAPGAYVVRVSTASGAAALTVAR